MRLKKLCKHSILGFCLLIVSDTFSQSPGDSLAFQILEKEAAEYERGIAENLNDVLAEYIPENRFNVSVRIYWNPEKVGELKFDPESYVPPKAPEPKKLPGFPILIAEESRGGYTEKLPAGNKVYRIRIHVLLDDSLPEKDEEFVKGLVPTQPGFVPERGDFLEISRLPFPDKSASPGGDASGFDSLEPVTPTDLLPVGFPAGGQGESNRPVLIHPLIQKYAAEYQKYVEDKISAVLEKYISADNFEVGVKVNWNETGIERLQKTLFLDEYESKVKLPGFKLYLEDQRETFEIISNSKDLMQMDVTVLLNRAMGEASRDFVEKIVPLSGEYSKKRGDRLVIHFNDFPDRKLPDGNLAEDLEKLERDVSADGVIDGEELVKAAEELEKSSGEGARFVNADPELDARTSIVLLKAREYYHRDKLNLALEKVLEALRINGRSHKAFEMLGSIYYRLNWTELALKNWKISLELNPDNKKLREYLNRVAGERTVLNVQR